MKFLANLTFLPDSMLNDYDLNQKIKKKISWLKAAETFINENSCQKYNRNYI